jgi:hypothetical protein
MKQLSGQLNDSANLRISRSNTKQSKFESHSDNFVQKSSNQSNLKTFRDVFHRKIIQNERRRRLSFDPDRGILFQRGLFDFCLLDKL